MDIVLVINIIIAIAVIIILIYILKQNNNNINSDIIKRTSDEAQNINRAVIELKSSLKEDFSISRKEFSDNSKEGREELANALTKFSDSLSKYMTQSSDIQKERLTDFSSQIEKLTNSNETKLSALQESISSGLDRMRMSVDERMKSIEEKNEKKLEEMRTIVDTKLQETLDKQISMSFKNVNDNLERVNKGIGEMKNLASDVGDLKKVLSNVKTRGVFGEYQLGNILEQVLTPEQYDINVATNPQSRNHVEFAIKLPGKDEKNPVWLPIDSKFPLESYNRLSEAYQSSDKDNIEKERKELFKSIKKFAIDIKEKYVHPPYTTDFAILFLPTEGLYAEALSDVTLMDELQNSQRIMLAGPNTLAALLNSLSMGFRTLRIEQRTFEVWEILQEIKKEFGKFAESLEKAKDKVDGAGKELDNLISTRSNVMRKKLDNITDEDEPQLRLKD